MRFLTRVTVLAVITFLLCQPCTWGRKKDKPEVESKPANIVEVKLNLVPFVTAGLVTGKAAEQIDDMDGDPTDWALYGGGLSLLYHPRPRLAVGLNIAYIFKEMPGDDVKSGRAWLNSANFNYYFQTGRKTNLYTRLDIGLVRGEWPRSGPDLNVGTRPYTRLSLGMFNYTSGALNTRVELYYLYVFSEGYAIEDLGGYEVDYNAQCVGLEFGVGFPLR